METLGQARPSVLEYVDPAVWTCATAWRTVSRREPYVDGQARTLLERRPLGEAKVNDLSC